MNKNYTHTHTCITHTYTYTEHTSVFIMITGLFRVAVPWAGQGLVRVWLVP